MEPDSAKVSTTTIAHSLDALVRTLLRHWLLAVNVVLGVFATLPWLAPAFMQLGWEWPARAIYTIYGFFCHQLPQRSWFLFGDRLTLPLAEIQRVIGASSDVFALRRFIGNDEVGWKLAWSDRMVSFYGGWFLFGLIYALVRNRTRGLRWRTALLLLIPMVVDGLSHAVSDFWGMGLGFRETNEWLAVLTGRLLPATFYAGDAWGSFNSLMRLGTGLLAAYALIFLLFPVIDRAANQEGRNTTLPLPH